MFRIYCYPKSNPAYRGKEEGTVCLTDERNKLIPDGEIHFHSYDEIGGIIRKAMEETER